MNRIGPAMLLAFVLGVVATASAVQGTLAPSSEPTSAPDEARLLVERSMDQFDQGIEIMPDDPEAARALFSQAATGLDRARRLADVENHRLLLNIGNAHLLAGDIGPAVLNLRRAERLRPANDRVASALADARARVGASVVPDARTRLLDAAFSWRSVVPRAVLMWIVVGGYLLLWTLAIARLAGFDRIGVRAAVGVGTIAAVSLLVLLGDQAMMVQSDDAVVVAPRGVIGLNGPSEGVYEPSFEDALPAGLEVRVLEIREGWARVKLIDSRETWVPLDAIEPV